MDASILYRLWPETRPSHRPVTTMTLYDAMLLDAIIYRCRQPARYRTSPVHMSRMQMAKISDECCDKRLPRLVHASLSLIEETEPS